ncbi:MAG: toxin-antitoxin system HicB family antitoxin [bacterium]|nr:toxin-antitoxin system HicB family antitoxin [bacterium]
MSRLSLRLPETLHQQLAFQARREGVSLNQYLVFLLARFSGPAYSARPARESAEQQRENFSRLRQQLNSASPEENRKALQELREAGPSDPELTPELMERYQRLRSGEGEDRK